MNTQSEREFIECVLPKGTLEWFDIVQTDMYDGEIHVVLEEKNVPPTKERAHSKGLGPVTITDFPIRGRKTTLTFKRRVWQEEATGHIVKRDIKLAFPGTQLEREFADFLKDKSRDVRRLLGEYC